MQPAKTRAALIAAVLVAAAISHAAPVSAATGLAMVATDSSCAGKPVNTACGGRDQTGQIYRVPLDTDLVRVMTDGKTVANWDSNAYAWAIWKNVAPGQFYDQCDTDVPVGSPVPDGACQVWSMKARAAAPAAFSASPTSGPAPLAVTVTWNIPSGSACQAGGGWSGAKAAAGSEVVTINASASLTLACTVPGPNGPGSAVLSWAIPTQNTDGSALTDLAGFNLYSGTTNPPTIKLSPMLAKNVTTYTFSNLPDGSTQWFGITSQNAAGAESDMVVGSKLIAGQASTKPWSGAPIAISITTPPPKKPRAPALSVQ
jgi:hypothetical protein